MEDKDKKPEEPNPPSDSKEPMIEEAPKEYKCQDDMVGMKDMITRLLAKVEKIYEWEQAEHEGGMEEEGMEDGMNENPDMLPEEQPAEDDFSADGSPLKPSQPMKGEENPMKKPSSVAYQASREMAMAMQEQARVLQSVAKRLDRLENAQNFSSDETKLKQICNENSLNFQEQASILRKFSSSQDRATYMSSLAMLKPAAKHPAGSIAFPSQGTMLTSSDKVLQKYQAEPPQQKQIAQNAYTVYSETVQQPDRAAAQKFQRSWPSVEKFVDYIVSQSSADPQVLDRMTSR